jgi:hypothetical protein
MKERQTMQPTSTQMQSDPYLVYERAGCPWKVLVQQDGNEEQYVADFRLDWEGTAIFTLLPGQVTQRETPLLRICLAPHADAAEVPALPAAISTQSCIPAVVSIEPAQHHILVELLCAVYSVDEPPVVLVAPDPALALRFLHPEDDPFEELYAAGAREALIQGR